jgi:CHAD domain-containing protein
MVNNTFNCEDSCNDTCLSILNILEQTVTDKKRVKMFYEIFSNNFIKHHINCIENCNFFKLVQDIINDINDVLYLHSFLNTYADENTYIIHNNDITMSAEKDVQNFLTKFSV